MTDILNKNDWLCLMDFIVVNWEKPDLLLFFLVAYYGNKGVN